MCLLYTTGKDLNAVHSNGDNIMKCMYSKPYSTMDRWRSRPPKVFNS